MGDLSSRRGKIAGMDPEGRYQKVRGAVPLAELIKVKYAHEYTNARGSTEESAEQWAQLMKTVIKGYENRIDLIVAHSPGDRSTDENEVRALRQALGKAVTRIPITTTKWDTGSGFASAGAILITAAVKMVATGEIPPVANYVPDLSLNLNIVRKSLKLKRVRTALLPVRAMDGTIGAALIGGIDDA